MCCDRQAVYPMAVESAPSPRRMHMHSRWWECKFTLRLTSPTLCGLLPLLLMVTARALLPLLQLLDDAHEMCSAAATPAAPPPSPAESSPPTTSPPSKRHQQRQQQQQPSGPSRASQAAAEAFLTSVRAALADDLHTTQAIASLSEPTRMINELVATKSKVRPVIASFRGPASCLVLNAHPQCTILLSSSVPTLSPLGLHRTYHLVAVQCSCVIAV